MWDAWQLGKCNVLCVEQSVLRFGKCTKASSYNKCKGGGGSLVPYSCAVWANTWRVPHPLYMQNMCPTLSNTPHVPHPLYMQTMCRQSSYSCCHPWREDSYYLHVIFTLGIVAWGLLMEGITLFRFNLTQPRPAHQHPPWCEKLDEPKPDNLAFHVHICSWLLQKNITIAWCLSSGMYICFYIGTLSHQLVWATR